MTQQAQTSVNTRSARPPVDDVERKRAKRVHDIIGEIDITAGLTGDVMNVVEHGIPDANFDDESWRRKTDLDLATPEARPGYVQRWVRIRTVDGRPDNSNKAKAFQSGWRPRLAETVSQDVHVPVYEDSRLGGIIVFADELLLCERPKQLDDEMNRRMRLRQDEINQAIYNKTKQSVGMDAKYSTLRHETDSLVDDD